MYVTEDLWMNSDGLKVLLKKYPIFPIKVNNVLRVLPLRPGEKAI